MDAIILSQPPFALKPASARWAAQATGGHEVLAHGRDAHGWLHIVVRIEPGRYRDVVVLPNGLVDTHLLSHNLVRTTVAGLVDPTVLAEPDPVPDGYVGVY